MPTEIRLSVEDVLKREGEIFHLHYQGQNGSLHVASAMGELVLVDNVEGFDDDPHFFDCEKLKAEPVYLTLCQDKMVALRVFLLIRHWVRKHRSSDNTNN